MQTESFVSSQIKQQAMLPLFYDDNVDTCIAITKALYEAGIRCIEFTNRGVNAFGNFIELLKLRDELKGLLMGIGTIKSSEDANKFIDAGADFLISPIFESGIADVAYLNKILWIPGCMTPTEINAAQMAGCTMIKLFPGNLLKPSYVEAIMPLFSGLDFLVTGGVDTTRESIESWFNAGVSGVGMGSKLITKEVIKTGDFTRLTMQTKEVMAMVQSAKK